MHNPFSILTPFERGLWAVSASAVTLAFFVGGGGGLAELAASLIGVTSLILIARGHVAGQALTVVFSLLYGAISFRAAYYGEMLTYLGMTGPIAALSVVSWLRHPFARNSSEVRVARLHRRYAIVLAGLTALVTFAFYFVLRFFGTASLGVSTLSIATSFLASALMFLRSPLYALAYAANDVVLVALWLIAAVRDPSALPMAVCFFMFFANDLYGFVSWRRMERRQAAVQEQ